MHKVEVIGVRGRSLWSLLIKLKSPMYQHIATIIDGTFVYHSISTKGVTIDEIIWDKKDYDVIKTYMLSKEEYKILLEEIQEKRFLKYSFYECVKVILKGFGIIVKRDSIKPNCVETATEWLVRLKELPCKELYEVRLPDKFVEVLKNGR